MTGKRAPRKATATYLRNAALYYLDRYASSTANLRRILMAKVDRSARAHGTDRAKGAAAVEVLLADFTRDGLLDDARYAQGRALALYRRGASARAIRARLSAKGVAREHIDPAIATLRDEAEEPDLTAALTFARRRRLGPYRPPGTRADRRARDLAALGRQGFTYDVARRVIDAEDVASLEDEVGGHSRM
jgi:regulatory protein